MKGETRKVNKRMKIFVKVKTKAKVKEVIKQEENSYLVSVSEPPLKNKANLAVIKALAEYFQVPKSKVILVRGEKSKQKVFEII